MSFYAVFEVAGVASVQHDDDVLFQVVPPLCCPPMLNSSRLKGGHNELPHSLKRRGPGSVAHSVSDPHLLGRSVFGAPHFKARRPGMRLHL